MFLNKNSSQSAVKNIVTLNAYTNKKYVFKGDSFQPLNKLSYNASNFIASYVSNKDVISTTVNLSRSIPNEDITDILEIKAYEELGLDQATNYVITHTEVENPGEDRIFNLFVIDPEVLDELYLPIKQNTKYIDLIVPGPLLYKVLYKKDILQDHGTHCFIYFTKYDAFVTFYKNGQFLYSKSMDFSLEQIYEKYCELVGEKVPENEFYSVLESEGLKTSKDEYEENLKKIFAEIFITINDIIIYAKRAFQLDTIDHMFIGSVQGPIIGLDEYSQTYLGLQYTDLNFNYNVKNDEWYIDQFQYMMLLNAFEYMEDEDSVVNLSIYPRPPAFLNRASGQFIVSTMSAVSLALLYPLYFLITSYINDAQIYKMTMENNKLSAEANRYKQILGEKKKVIAGLDSEIEKISKVYVGKTKTLTSIYDKKVNYRLKSATFFAIADDLNQYDVHVNGISTDNDMVYLSLVTEDDRKFTEVIKHISEKHFNEINGIDIEEITKDPESNYYTGLLKVELK